MINQDQLLAGLDSRLEDLTTKLLDTRKVTDNAEKTVTELEQILDLVWSAQQHTLNSYLLSSSEHQAALREIERLGSAFLTRVIATYFTAESMESDIDSPIDISGFQMKPSLLTRASNLAAKLARLTGDAAVPSITWALTPDLQIPIAELSFESCAFGWKTWAAGALFAHYIATGRISVKNETILELGCGTGIVGIVTAKMGAKQVYLTDYQLETLKNCQRNVVQNNCSETAKVQALDWSWVTPSLETSIPESASAEIPPLSSTTFRFKVIFGADICYDPLHGTLVPRTCAQFLAEFSDARVYFVTGLRRGVFDADIEHFENQMTAWGFVVVFRADISRDDFIQENDHDTRIYSESLAHAIFQSSAAVSSDEKQFRFYEYRREKLTAITHPSINNCIVYEQFENRFNGIIALLIDRSVDVSIISNTLEKLGNMIDEAALHEKKAKVDATYVNPIDPNHLAIIKKLGGNYCTFVVNSLSYYSNEEIFVLTVKAQKVLQQMQALFSDSTVHGAAFKTGITRNIQISNSKWLQLRELSFSEAAYGWQTWSAGIVFASMIATGFVKFPKTAKTIFELGCGTGILGIATTCTIGDEAQVILTDYSPAILENARHNILLNEVMIPENSKNISVRELDWRNVCNFDSSLLETADVIIAADVCYELEHANLVPPVCNSLLRKSNESRVFIMSTLRRGFGIEIAAFEKAMCDVGFSIEKIDISRNSFEYRFPFLNSVFEGVDKNFRLCIYKRDAK
ncbi:Methyltransferase-like protein 22 [Physocladia obscura]|uniref:Methyltransferase-like protein 22 n=1 Tax=Physocladia obscura TaxID=109957 RepID=A0AAD5XII5_9FUNG|nr:Methyltransferase-like protein 22 [Physocladia obscura]